MHFCPIDGVDQFAHLLNGEPERVDLAEASDFLDEHLLRWIDQFAERVALRGDTRFYAGLALLTAAYLQELRDLLADPLGYPRPAPEELETRLTAADFPTLDAEGPFVPGAAPGW